MKKINYLQFFHIRITSYNVCYTKLLRGVVDVLGALNPGRAFGVERHGTEDFEQRAVGRDAQLGDGVGQAHGERLETGADADQIIRLADGGQAVVHLVEGGGPDVVGRTVEVGGVDLV